MTPEQINEARIIIADGVVVKNNTQMSDEEARTAKPWLIPPKGYRLVTAEERNKDYPKCDVMWFKGAEWVNSLGDCGWGDDDFVFAVQEGYTFEPETKKMTVAEVCELAGCNVEIIKG